MKVKEVSTRFSPERTAELFNNAMSAALQRHGVMSCILCSTMTSA